VLLCTPAAQVSKPSHAVETRKQNSFGGEATFAHCGTFPFYGKLIIELKVKSTDRTTGGQKLRRGQPHLSLELDRMSRVKSWT
jgi:hypothetical protein